MEYNFIMQHDYNTVIKVVSHIVNNLKSTWRHIFYYLVLSHLSTLYPVVFL